MLVNIKKNSVVSYHDTLIQIVAATLNETMFLASIRLQSF